MYDVEQIIRKAKNIPSIMGDRLAKNLIENVCDEIERLENCNNAITIGYSQAFEVKALAGLEGRTVFTVITGKGSVWGYYFTPGQDVYADNYNAKLTLAISTVPFVFEEPLTTYAAVYKGGVNQRATGFYIEPTVTGSIVIDNEAGSNDVAGTLTLLFSQVTSPGMKSNTKF